MRRASPESTSLATPSMKIDRAEPPRARNAGPNRHSPTIGRPPTATRPSEFRDASSNASAGLDPLAGTTMKSAGEPTAKRPACTNRSILAAEVVTIRSSSSADTGAGSASDAQLVEQVARSGHARIGAERDVERLGAVRVHQQPHRCTCGRTESRWTRDTTPGRRRPRPRAASRRRRSRRRGRSPCSASGTRAPRAAAARRARRRRRPRRGARRTARRRRSAASGAPRPPGSPRAPAGCRSSRNECAQP